MGLRRQLVLADFENITRGVSRLCVPEKPIKPMAFSANQVLIAGYRRFDPQSAKCTN
jgi:hypothetical protein